MSIRDLPSGRLGRTLRSLSGAGLGIGERNEAGRPGRTSPPSGATATEAIAHGRRLAAAIHVRTEPVA